MFSTLAVLEMVLLATTLATTMATPTNTTTYTTPCGPEEECLPVISCPTVLHKLQEVWAEPALRAAVVDQLRGRICGAKAARQICCPAAPLGVFQARAHMEGGVLHALDSSTLLVTNLTYDGRGPDAFLLAGTEGEAPSEQGALVVLLVALVAQGTYAPLEYTDPSIPALPAISPEDATVFRLPAGVTVAQLRWVSVWCRAFAFDFGHVVLPGPAAGDGEVLPGPAAGEGEVLPSPDAGEGEVLPGLADGGSGV